ncbi:S1 RNA-binding domain-containing protein [Chroococcidiopsis sp.]|uniref:S1 RNA-binding domain-containing protein n=1 Tax=Chroococcidiopsis sp. TaxID=3088168 RepID=UPI003F350732
MKSDSTPSVSSSSFSMEDFAKALEQHDYQFQKGQTVRGKVFQYDSNGAYVDIGGKSAAFLPADQASLQQVTDLSTILPLQEELEFLIIRDQDADGQVTLSRRQLEIQHIWERIEQMQENRQTVQVRVTGANKGGVTVDVLGLRGFIPRSHLVEKENMESLKGQTLTASVLEVDYDNKKLVLSNRLATRASSFSQLEIGQLATGKISSIQPFGVFVDLNGVSGLLHIKQVSQNYTASLPALFKIGQEIKAVIIDLDEGRGRISLSTKVLENYPGEIQEKMDEVMTNAEARANKARKLVSEE